MIPSLETLSAIAEYESKVDLSVLPSRLKQFGKNISEQFEDYAGMEKIQGLADWCMENSFNEE